MCGNGAQQPRMKIRSTPTDSEQKAQNEEWRPEILNDQSQLTAVPNEYRDLQ